MDWKGDQQHCGIDNPSTSENCAENLTAQQPQHCMDGTTNADSLNLAPSLCHFSLGQKRSFKSVVNFNISNGTPTSQIKVKCTVSSVGIRDRDF